MLLDWNLINIQMYLMTCTFVFLYLCVLGKSILIIIPCFIIKWKISIVQKLAATVAAAPTKTTVVWINENPWDFWTLMMMKKIALELNSFFYVNIVFRISFFNYLFVFIEFICFFFHKNSSCIHRPSQKKNLKTKHLRKRQVKKKHLRKSWYTGYYWSLQTNKNHSGTIRV